MLYEVSGQERYSSEFTHELIKYSCTYTCVSLQIYPYTWCNALNPCLQSRVVHQCGANIPEGGLVYNGLLTRREGAAVWKCNYKCLVEGSTNYSHNYK